MSSEVPVAEEQQILSTSVRCDAEAVGRLGPMTLVCRRNSEGLDRSSPDVR